jgi:hypothetical protein
MKKNMGLADRLIRVLMAVAVIVLYVMGAISGNLALILGVFSLIFLLTSAVGFCPLYVLFRINTCSKK